MKKFKIFIATLVLVLGISVLGAEKVIDTDLAPVIASAGWSGTGWTISDEAGTATHTSGVTALSPVTPIPAVLGDSYRISLTITGTTSGTISIYFGSSDPIVISENGLFSKDIIAVNTTGFSIVPKATFNGVISRISIGHFAGEGISTSGRFISTIPTGTAPFTASSTTACPNLNSTYLQGYTPAQLGGISTAGSIYATKLQNAARDLGSADVNIDLSNSNSTGGTWKTNMTIDGAYTAVDGFLGNATTVTGILEGTPVNAVAGTGTLTSDETAPSDGDTVTIGSAVYTFKTAFSSEPTVAFEVLIGISAATALDNLKATVNLSGTEGVEYSVGTTIHPSVTAGTNTDTTQAFTAKTKGTAGNVASTETSDHLSWGDTTLLGGIDGTIGVAGQLLYDATYLYIAIDTNTIADANWRRISLGSAY